MATPAYAASAANPRVMDLPGCTDGAVTNAGGWVTRQVTFQGTDDPDFVGQIRPRTVRLGELCKDGSDIGFPFTATDMNPADNTYSPGVTGGWDNVCSTESGHTYCMELLGPGIYSGGTAYDVWCFAYTIDGVAVGSGVTVPFGLSFNGGSFGGGTRTSGAASGECSTITGTQLVYTRFPPATSYETYAPTSSSSPTTTGNFSGSSSSPLGATIGGTYGSPFTMAGADDGSAFAECSTSASGGVTDTIDIESVEYFEQDWAPVYDPGDTDHENPTWSRSFNIVTEVDIDDCPFIVNFTINLCYWDLENNVVCSILTWGGSRYVNQVPYSDPDPVTDVCTKFPAWQGCGVEQFPDIVCEIEYTDPGNPITVIGEFFGGLPGWVVCMTLPIGWDRQGLIARQWDNGNIASLADAYNAAVPNGIGCGVVGGWSMPWGDISIDTCDMDVAPSWAKIAIGGIIILGIAALAVKRIMWAVGSKG